MKCNSSNVRFLASKYKKYHDAYKLPFPWERSTRKKTCDVVLRYNNMTELTVTAHTVKWIWIGETKSLRILFLRMRALYCYVVVCFALCVVNPLSGEEVKAEEPSLAVHTRDEAGGPSQVAQVGADDSQHAPKNTDKEGTPLNLQSDTLHGEEISRFVSRVH